MTCRVRAQQYGFRLTALASLSAVLLVLSTIGACRRGVPAVDRSPRPEAADGTLSGTVRGSQGTTPVEGRLVEVVNVASGERQRALTNSAGGFTFKVKPGRYRVELALREGERLVKDPGTVDVNRRDLDAFADLVLGTTPVSRPRGPYRLADGLGSPVA